MSNLKKLREHYDTEDQSEALAEAVVENDVEADVLVSTSIRLSKSTLDEVRAQALASGVPATTLMRRWIEAQVDGSPDAMVVSVAELESFIASRARHSS